MKKILKLLLTALLSSLCLVSCGKKVNDKIILETKEGITELIPLEANTFRSMVEADASFVVVLANQSCTACQAFEPLINEYIKQTGYKIYVVESLVTDVFDYPYTPTLAVISNGELLSSINPLTNGKEDVFNNINALSTYLEERLITGVMSDISIDTVRSKIKNGDEFVLYLGWDQCGDCAYLRNNFLEDYFYNNKVKNQIYYLETAEWRTYKPSNQPNRNNFDTDEEYEKELEYWNTWIDFATEFGIVDYYNGKVPTLQYYSDGKLVENFVYLNDIGNYSIKDGETVMEITDSYWDDNPYVGKTMKYSEYKDTVAKGYYNKKLTSFLNKYLK